MIKGPLDKACISLACLKGYSGTKGAVCINAVMEIILGPEHAGVEVCSLNRGNYWHSVM